MSVPALRFRDEAGQDFPEWKLKSLIDVCNKVLDGTHFSPKSIEGKRKYLTSKNIRNTGIDLTNMSYISENEHKEIYKKCPVKYGDILLTKDGANTGNCCLNSLHEEFSLLSSVAVLSGKVGIALNAFLLQTLQSSLGINTINNAMAGQAISRITLEKINKFKFNFPSFEEQTKIANFLTAVDEKITHLTQKHDLLTQYKKGVMQQIFSQELRFKDDDGQNFPEWEDKYLSNICSIQKGKQLNKSELTSHDLYPVINGGQEPSGYTDIWNVEGNSITISEGGNSCGFVNFIKQKFWSGGHCYTLTALNDDASKNFLYQLLKFNEVKIMKLRVGSGLPNIQKSALSEFMVGFPISIKEQTKIANFLTAIDDKITATQTQLQAVKQYKQGLLQQMFV